MITKNESLLTVDEAANRAQVHPQTIRRWIKKGELPAIRLGDGPTARFRIRQEEFEAFLNRLVFHLSTINIQTTTNPKQTSKETNHGW